MLGVKNLTQDNSRAHQGPPTPRPGLLDSPQGSFKHAKRDWTALGAYMHVVLATICTTILTFAPKWGLAWWENLTKDDSRAHQGGLIPGPGLLDSPQGSFKHAKRSWAALRAYMHVVLAITFTKKLTFAPKWGLAWWEMVILGYKSGYEPGPKLHEPCS